MTHKYMYMGAGGGGVPISMTHKKTVSLSSCMHRNG